MSNRHRFRLFRPVLRPSEGRRLPRELHVRRVGRLARALPDGVRDPGFEILLRRIDNAPILGGNRVQVYFKGQDAFAAMHEAVVGARKEILLESYIYKDDAAGRRFLEELSVAARRGVEVNVLADALGSFSTRNAFWQEMKRRGIHVRLYHPLFSSLWYQPFRDHRKILVVDRRIAFTGGMNIGEEYGSTSASLGETWRDTHVRVEGPAAWEMAVVFSEGWVQAGGEPLELPSLPAEEAAAPGTRILVLDSRPSRGSAESASAMAAIVGAARERVWLTNAYFAPGWAAVRILGDAAQRGVDVRLLLPGKTDVPIVRRAAHGYYDRLLARGVRIFEYQTSILHAKSLTADGYVTLVGSTNLDFRSFLFNAECDLLMLDETVARRAEEAFEDDRLGAVEIHRTLWRRRTFLEKTGDRFARMLAPVL
ncbi:MAG TPA: phospholipase D-like domain-containing protein [Thermoanaerobaculia bacterium]|jgi:cardiolipin synthase|nr:phospholipase D-like domain-containing protein [Thermoanaerobaculia bacterium]